ncbi:hypothetical protein A2397_05925 [Candidatus Amesbacteria bacterium RIFOXYB1_FULL_44_23]|uniref:Type IV pilus modification protein PilV n=1 Tax=Candidatus Amesbacteria bacterium RIFOXYB1_FULL_44_23 TaxID=1797263 RepID=A0A1F4ZU38_9BACT|nr:MAG: hypothetical protein A2397_05925 [Candidatus Amesbacteria bacterium RIFOXYB1_FULL_44_23]
MRSRLLKGMGIVEVMIGASVAAVGLVAVIQLATRAMSNSGLSARASVAAKYADEGMAWLKDWEQANGWQDIADRACVTAPCPIPSTRAYCFNDLGFTLSSCPVGDVIDGSVEFMRTMTLSTLAVGTDTVIRGRVFVTWIEGNKPYTIRRYYEFIRN